jgi:hypothetical protein
MFVYYAFYGWAFTCGGYSRWTELKTSEGEIINSGVVMTCIFLIIISTISLGGIAATLNPVM